MGITSSHSKRSTLIMLLDQPCCVGSPGSEARQCSKVLDKNQQQQQPFQLVMGKGPDGRSIPLGVISTQGQV